MAYILTVHYKLLKVLLLNYYFLMYCIQLDKVGEVFFLNKNMTAVCSN